MPNESTEPTEESTIGYVTDKVDHFNRDPYKLVSLSLNTATTYVQMINDNLENWGTVLNYEINIFNANQDYDGYINEMYTQAGQGADGFICGMDISLMPRVYEVCEELGVAYVGGPTAFTDEDGHIIAPSVNQDEYGNGAMTMKWLADNYTNYWSDPIADESTLGLIIIDFSAVDGIHARVPGVQDTFEAEFPGAVDNIYICDLLSHPSGFSNIAATDLTSATITAHSEIERWFVVACVDDWAVGATRAVESLGKEDIVLVASDQADAFIAEMGTGYEGSVYVAGCAISTAELSGYMAACVVAILEGRATEESIWPEWVRSGDNYACIDLPGTMITRDTYEKWLTDTSFESLSAGMKTS
jgi:ABC-type sugar transport system substrate-binding protein